MLGPRRLLRFLADGLSWRRSLLRPLLARQAFRIVARFVSGRPGHVGGQLRLFFLDRLRRDRLARMGRGPGGVAGLLPGRSCPILSPWIFLALHPQASGRAFARCGVSRSGAASFGPGIRRGLVAGPAERPFSVVSISGFPSRRGSGCRRFVLVRPSRRFFPRALPAPWRRLRFAFRRR